MVKEWEKDFSKFLSGRERVLHFSAKKSCGNVRKVMPRVKTKGRVIMQINANNLYQRKVL
jgi:hypothetical protein